MPEAGPASTPTHSGLRIAPSRKSGVGEAISEGPGERPRTLRLCTTRDARHSSPRNNPLKPANLHPYVKARFSLRERQACTISRFQHNKARTPMFSTATRCGELTPLAAQSYWESCERNSPNAGQEGETTGSPQTGVPTNRSWFVGKETGLRLWGVHSPPSS
jgi:hypothetical protein